MLAGAYAAWGLTYAGMIACLLAGRLNAVPYHAYVDAGHRWLTRAPLYDLSNIDGFQYLPQSAAFFALFARLGPPYADVLWRGLCLAGYVSGQRRLSRFVSLGHSAWSFSIATGLSIIPVGNVLSNGQANLALAALSLHAVAALLLRRYWLLSTMLACGFALKPLMLVPLLVVVALDPQTRLRTLACLVLLALWPFVSAGPDYVLQQYADCMRKLQVCAQPERLFEDLRSMLFLVHIRPSERAFFELRAAFAVLTLVACGISRRRLREPLASCHVMALALSYLMLFNPRTLSTSYVMVAGFGSLLTAAYWARRRQLTAAALAGCTLIWNLNHHVVPPIVNWSNALGCCAFVAVLLREVTRRCRLHAGSRAAGYERISHDAQLRIDAPTVPTRE